MSLEPQQPPWAAQQSPPPAYSGYPVQPYGAYPPPPPSQPASGLYQAAAIINWVMLALVVVATCGFGLIAAAWVVPMTIYIHKGAKDRRKHVALGVCTLLFCNLISGILMLIDEGNRS